MHTEKKSSDSIDIECLLGSQHLNFRRNYGRSNMAKREFGSVPGETNPSSMQSLFLFPVCVCVSVSNVDFSLFLFVTKATFILS